MHEPPSSREHQSLGFVANQRVHAAGDPKRTGTVRYVGPLEGYPGEWIGVEWDDGKGKHDGIVNGVRYFATAEGEMSGSFVRPKSLSSGIGLLVALQLRYRGEYTKEEEDEMYVFSTRRNRVSIELVGRDKIQEKLNHFQELTSVSVSYMGVSSTGPLQEITSVLPNLKELNMAGNLFSKWQDIGAICEALPALEILHLTGCRLRQGIEELPLLKNIHILILNNCGITWNEVEILEKSLPAVQELHLMRNKIKTIVEVDSSSMAKYITGFDSLRLLNLDDNGIEGWDEIMKFSQLTRLEQLYLNKNKLKHIHHTPFIKRFGIPQDGEYQEQCSRPFENLHCLLLGCNEIEDLASVDSLNCFPNLIDIRLSENPIVDPEKGNIPRFILIARLAKVKMLNGSEISLRERKESEIRYVRLVMSKMHLDDPEQIKQLHPRFAELKQLHGMDDERPTIRDKGPQKMALGLLSITLKCVGASIGEKPPLTKKLPPTTTVGKLKALCESFFKLKAIKPRLLLQEEGSPFPALLDDEMASLIDMGIGTNEIILVDEET